MSKKVLVDFNVLFLCSPFMSPIAKWGGENCHDAWRGRGSFESLSGREGAVRWPISFQLGPVTAPACCAFRHPEGVATSCGT